MRDFTRCNKREPVTCVMVSPARTQNGRWSRRRIVYASFRLSIDAHRWAEDLRRRNPTWLIEVKTKG